MNPITANPAVALAYVRHTNDERVRRAEEQRLARRPRDPAPRRTKRLSRLSLVWHPRAVRRRAATG
ncbi:hypothetical protein [Nocardioides koreensis]